MNHLHSQQGSVVGWVALVVAALALAVGVVALNRSGVDLDTLVAQQVEQATASLQQDLDATRQAASEQTQRFQERFDSLAADARQGLAEAGAEADADARLAAARAAAATRLAAIEVRENSEETRQVARQELAAARAALDEAYRDGSSRAQEEWEPLLSGFERAEAALRDGTADGVQAFRNALEQLERELRGD